MWKAHMMIMLSVGCSTRSINFETEPQYIPEGLIFKEDDAQSHCYWNKQNKRGKRKFKKFGSK